MSLKNPATAIKPQYAELTYKIDPGARLEIMIAADFIACLAATTPFKLSLDEAPETNFEAGLTYRAPAGFERAAVINTGPGQISVTFGIGKGDFRDARLSLAGSLSTKERQPEILTTGAAVSAATAAVTLLAAANANRKTVMVNNMGAGDVYIGGAAGALAGEGMPLAPGQERGFDTTAALYARNDTGAAIALAVAELEFTP